MAGAGRARASVLLAREEDDREEAVVGWAGQLQCWAGRWCQVSALGRFSLSLVFLFINVFYFLQLVLI